VTVETRPAFYALERGGWRDYVTLLHLPYTAWHLSYVAIGCALAPVLHTDRLLAALAAFFLALGVAAHALDELRGSPLDTAIPRSVLVGLAAISLAGAVAIGVASALVWTPWLLAFVAVGGFLVPAYNLELFGGRFHSNLWFGIAWGAFPVLTGYFVMAERVDPEAVLAAIAALFLSLAQRQLSTQVRTVRRRVRAVGGTVAYCDGSEEEITRDTLKRAPELALRTMTLATITLAAALIATHV
jgi:heme O synthase-like polyprenyltransferase